MLGESNYNWESNYNNCHAGRVHRPYVYVHKTDSMHAFCSDVNLKKENYPKVMWIIWLLENSSMKRFIQTSGHYSKSSIKSDTINPPFDYEYLSIPESSMTAIACSALCCRASRAACLPWRAFSCSCCCNILFSKSCCFFKFASSSVASCWGSLAWKMKTDRNEQQRNCMSVVK